jgi:putative spermidine/putrescine transport system ATP-binding protein
MSDGRIEQIGTPSEIYNFPATPFVASFVGTLNLVDAGVVDAAGARLAIAGQEVRAARPITVAGNGAQVLVALRPESLSLGSGPEGSNRLTGTVDEVSFLGSIVRVRLRAGDSVLVSLDTFNDPNLVAPSHGDPVTAWFAPEAVLVLDRAGGSGVPAADPVAGA